MTFREHDRARERSYVDSKIVASDRAAWLSVRAGSVSPVETVRFYVVKEPPPEDSD